MTAAQSPPPSYTETSLSPPGNVTSRAFASGAVRVLVATDIAARGIHVDGIDLVIHADLPAEYKAYLHRSGRTGRAGASGVVVTLQTPVQADDVRALMRKARAVPLAATVKPGSALLRSIAGKPAQPPAPQPDPGRPRKRRPRPAWQPAAPQLQAAAYRGRRRH